MLDGTIEIIGFPPNSVSEGFQVQSIPLAPKHKYVVIVMGYKCVWARLVASTAFVNNFVCISTLDISVQQ